MKLLLIAAVLLASAGCVSPLKITRLSEVPIDSADRTFVLTSNTSFDTEFRQALIKSKFKMKKFASVGSFTEAQKTVTGKGEQITGATYQKAEARYGLSLYSHVKGPCLFNSSVHGDFKLEVSDLRENEVLFVIEKGGYSGPCGGLGSVTVFEDLAGELNKLWSPRSPTGLVP